MNTNRAMLRDKFERACLHYGVGNLPAARAGFEQVIQGDAKHAGALYHLGLIARHHADRPAAASLFAKAVRADPRHVDAQYWRGLTLLEIGDREAALICLSRAIAMRPSHAESHLNRGTAFLRCGRLTEALEDYDTALSLRHDYADAYINRGVVFAQLRRLESALESLEQALRLTPDSPVALLNHSNVLRELGRFEAALTGYDRLIAAHPENPAAYYMRAQTRLLLGDYERGWIDFEWRLRDPQSGAYNAGRRFAQPPWRGNSSLEGKTVLLYAEQGLGDALQFCRYATLVARRGARVILEVPRPLQRLLAGLDGVAGVVLRGDPLPEFDEHCSLLSLPHAFKTSLETVPSGIPYLHADPEAVRSWGARLDQHPSLKVGVVWSGGSHPTRPDLWPVNARRNMPLVQLQPLEDARIRFFSLQKGEPAASELREIRAKGGDKLQLIDYAGELEDLADTAALAQNLDLIITVDTSVAHLAGALGKPVWVLNRFDSCWRWMLVRSDTPWYPTATLYRQEQPGNWDAVVQRVRVDLRARLDRGK